jgi:hypothetical protein
MTHNTKTKTQRRHLRAIPRPEKEPKQPMETRILTKKMTAKEYDAGVARLEARFDAAGSELRKIAEDMLALCDAAIISEIPGCGIPKAKKTGARVVTCPAAPRPTLRLSAGTDAGIRSPTPNKVAAESACRAARYSSRL